MIETVKRGHVKCVNLLTKTGADVNWSLRITLDGITTLQQAAVTGDDNTMSLLIKSGADVAALIYAAKGGHVQYLDQLIKEGADVNVVDNKQCTAVQYAAGSGFKTMRI